MSDAKQRQWNEDISGELNVTTTTDDTTLVTARNAKHTIFIQRVIFYVQTNAAQSMSLEDSDSSPKQVGLIPSGPGAGTRWDFDYGDEGFPLTEGKNFRMNVSAVGLAGRLKWYGYQRQTAVDNV